MDQLTFLAICVVVIPTQVLMFICSFWFMKKINSCSAIIAKVISELPIATLKSTPVQPVDAKREFVENLVQKIDSSFSTLLGRSEDGTNMAAVEWIINNKIVSGMLDLVIG